MYKVTILLPGLLLAAFLRAQDVEGVRILSGALSEEELDESEIEHFEYLEAHKLYINLASASRLASSGLLSPYQAASIIDYRSRYGDILSFTELGAVDGIGQEYAAALRPYVSLHPSSSLSSAGSGPGGEIRLRECVRKDGNGPPEDTYGLKLKANAGERLMAALAVKKPYAAAAWPPESVSGGVTLYGRMLLGKLVVGDFNVRFGQGLLSWSGFSLTGFSSVSAFSKRPTGITPAWTFSPSSAGRGVAAEFNIGRTTVSAVLSASPLLNVSHFSRRGQYGLSLTREAASADFRFAAGPVDLFAEFACRFQSASAFVCGAVYNPAYQKKLGLLLRAYPADYKVNGAHPASTVASFSDQYGISLGWETALFVTTLDAMFKSSDGSSRYRLLSSYKTSADRPLVLALRLTERFLPSQTPSFRTDLRSDLQWHSGAWQSSCRAEMLLCRGLGLLSYAEAGCKGLETGSARTALTAFARATVFRIDYWDDRIYVYERDAPGNFSVPSYYGRGYSLSAYGGLKRRLKKTRISLYARLSVISYPWNPEPKESRTELRLQASMDF